MKLFLPVAISLFFGASASLAKDSLFEFRGKSYQLSDLEPAQRQGVYDIEQQRFAHLNQVIDAAILSIYFEDKARAEKKSVDDLKKALLPNTPATDAEAKVWYEANKNLLPGRDFESIKGEIIQLISQQRNEERQAALVAEIKRSGNFKLAVEEPKPPKIEVATAGFPALGPSTAKVTIVEFADFQCPHCKAASGNLKKVVEKYKDKVRLVYLDFPINRSGVSRVVAEGAVCADQQKKYWEYHAMAFEQQGTMTDKFPGEAATKLGLNLVNFESCLKSPQPKERVEAAIKEGKRVGVRATPTLFINGVKQVEHDSDSLAKAIDKAL